MNLPENIEIQITGDGNRLTQALERFAEEQERLEAEKPKIDKIKSFELYDGTNNQENIENTLIDPKDLTAFSEIGSIANVKARQPKLAEKPDIKLTKERERVEKRNVLPIYDSKLETWKAEVIETTITRFMTHEPCVEHIPVLFEDKIDTEGVLQNLFKKKNPEEKDYLQYRNDDISDRYI